MKLSKRQEQIIAVVKEHQPVSGERISDILAVSRATLRSDLSFLTLSGILKASPKVGYTYESDNMEAFFFFDVFQTKVQEIMSPPLMVAQDTSIRDAITNLFMYDVGSLYVMDEAKELLGVLSRKDLLRASLNTNIDLLFLKLLTLCKNTKWILCQSLKKKILKKLLEKLRKRKF